MLRLPSQPTLAFLVLPSLRGRRVPGRLPFIFPRLLTSQATWTIPVAFPHQALGGWTENYSSARPSSPTWAQRPGTMAVRSFSNTPSRPPLPPTPWIPIIGMAAGTMVALVVIPPIALVTLIGGAGYILYRFLRGGVSSFPDGPVRGSGLLAFLRGIYPSFSDMSTVTQHKELFQRSVDCIKETARSTASGRQRLGDPASIICSPPHSISAESIALYGGEVETRVLMEFNVIGSHDVGLVQMEGVVFGGGAGTGAGAGAGGNGDVEGGGKGIIRSLLVQWKSDGKVEDITECGKGRKTGESSVLGEAGDSAPPKGHVFPAEFRQADQPSKDAS